MCLLKVGHFSPEPYYTDKILQEITIAPFQLFIYFIDNTLGTVNLCKLHCGSGYTRNYWYGDCEYTGLIVTSSPEAPKDCLGSSCSCSDVSCRAVEMSRAIVVFVVTMSMFIL